LEKKKGEMREIQAFTGVQKRKSKVSSKPNREVDKKRGGRENFIRGRKGQSRSWGTGARGGDKGKTGY